MVPIIFKNFYIVPANFGNSIPTTHETQRNQSNDLMRKWALVNKQFTFSTEDHMPSLTGSIIAGDFGVQKASSDVRTLGFEFIHHNSFLLLLRLFLHLGRSLRGHLSSNRTHRGSSAMEEHRNLKKWNQCNRREKKRGGGGEVREMQN